MAQVARLDDRLWRMVTKPLSSDECEQLLERYGPLVRSVALALVRKLPASVELDDLMQEGYIGLLSALLQATHQDAQGQFRSYLAQRVRGAMIDSLRRLDPGSRSVRLEMRRVEGAISELCHALGRQPSEGEVALKLGMPLLEYQSLLQQAHDYMLLSLEDFGGDGDGTTGGNFIDWCAATGSDPLAALQRRSLQRRLLQAISMLGERENAVLTAYYVEEMNMVDIGLRLGITESRVSQIRSQAIARLRAAVLDESQPIKPRWRLAG